jgi:hypothetical protein
MWAPQQRSQLTHEETAMTDTRPTEPPTRGLDRLLRIVGLAAHLAVAVFPFAATGLLAPLWAVVMGWAVWAGTAVLAWRVSRQRPRLTLLVPLIAAAIWYAFVVLAAAAFSWTP